MMLDEPVGFPFLVQNRNPDVRWVASLNVRARGQQGAEQRFPIFGSFSNLPIQ